MIRSNDQQGWTALSDVTYDLETSLPFPIEYLIRDTPRSHQSPNSKGKEAWKKKVGETATAHVNSLKEWFFIAERPLSVTIFYFSPIDMQGDVDNIVKLIIDGMIGVIYLNDRIIERIVVQKFEPGVEAIFHSLTPTLEQAIELAPPVIYIRIDGDLSWRQVR